MLAFGIGALIADTSGLGVSKEAPGKIGFGPKSGRSNSGRLLNAFLSMAVTVWGRSLTSPENSEGITVGPALAIPATGACVAGAAKLNTARQVAAKPSTSAAAMRGLKRPDWGW